MATTTTKTPEELALEAQNKLTEQRERFIEAMTRLDELVTPDKTAEDRHTEVEAAVEKAEQDYRAANPTHIETDPAKNQELTTDGKNGLAGIYETEAKKFETTINTKEGAALAKKYDELKAKFQLLTELTTEGEDKDKKAAALKAWNEVYNLYKDKKGVDRTRAIVDELEPKVTEMEKAYVGRKAEELAKLNIAFYESKAALQEALDKAIKDKKKLSNEERKPLEEAVTKANAELAKYKPSGNPELDALITERENAHMAGWAAKNEAKIETLKKLGTISQTTIDNWNKAKAKVQVDDLKSGKDPNGRGTGKLIGGLALAAGAVGGLMAGKSDVTDEKGQPTGEKKMGFFGKCLVTLCAIGAIAVGMSYANKGKWTETVGRTGITGQAKNFALGIKGNPLPGIGR